MTKSGSRGAESLTWPLSPLAYEPGSNGTSWARVAATNIRVEVDTARPADGACDRVQGHRAEHVVVVDGGQHTRRLPGEVEFPYEPVGERDTKAPASGVLHVDPASLEVLETHPGPLIVPTLVIDEVISLIATRLSSRAAGAADGPEPGFGHDVAMTGTGAVRIELLGEIRVVVHGSVTELRSAIQRRLLARLALAGGEVVPTARLIDLLWPDDAPATAATSLRNHVARLRAQVLGAIEHRPGGYAIVADLAIVDLVELERALDAAEGANTGDPDRETCERVLALDRGELCPEFSDEPFVLARARLLSERVLAVKVRHVRALMAAGDLDTACAGAVDLIGHHGDHEAAQVTAMEVLARAGRAPEALRVGGAFRRRLREHTGLPPSAAFVEAERAVFDAVNAHDVARPQGVLRTYATAIIGRGGELDTVSAAIGPGRLCTVVGPGGVGKTRVAVEAAGRVAEAFDAVCFVDLSTADSAHAATELLARAVGVGERARSALDPIALALKARSVLLVLDNCDQVVAGVRELLGALRPQCRDLGVIVTSRETLRLADEQCVALGPLDPVAAVELFRSASRRRTSDLEDDTMIGALVDLVDRLPLAIELAAAETDDLTLAELRTALTTQPLRPASPDGRVDRHSSIDRTIEWSWALLTAEERRALTRLALFVGPWEASDAAAVCADADLASAAATSVVTSLVRKSLITAELDGDVGRYRLPLTVRAFAHEKLRSSTDRTAAHRRLLGHLGEHLATAADLLYGPGERQASQWRERTLPTLRSALGWALSSGETDAAMDCLPPLLLVAGQLAIGFEQLPGADRHANAPHLVAAAALRESRPSELHRLTTDPALRRTTPRHEAFVHVTAARVLTTAGAPADEHHHRLTELAAAHDDPLVEFLAASAHWFEDPFGGAATMEWRHRALAAAVRLGAPSLVALCQYELIKGRFDPEAVAEYRRLLEVCRSHGNVQAAALCQMAIDYATPAPDTFVRLSHQTARAVDDNPHFFRYFAHHRAALPAVPLLRLVVPGHPRCREDRHLRSGRHLRPGHPEGPAPRHERRTRRLRARETPTRPRHLRRLVQEQPARHRARRCHHREHPAGRHTRQRLPAFVRHRAPPRLRRQRHRRPRPCRRSASKMPTAPITDATASSTTARVDEALASLGDVDVAEDAAVAGRDRLRRQPDRW